MSTCRPARPRRPGGAAAPVRPQSALPLAALLAAATGAARAQAWVPPPGFAAPVAFAERTAGASVRGVAFAEEHGWFAAIGPRLWQHAPGGAQILAHRLLGGDDIAFCRRDGEGRIVFAALRAGTVHRLWPHNGRLERFPGVANAFDLAPLPGGGWLLSANPDWPQPQAQTGVWHAAPGLAPRRLLTLAGPSGPLSLDAAGNLVAAELGATVPPPPGAVRLLRFPAARVQQALAGGALAPGDADLVGTGWDGAYALAFDPRERLCVTDGRSGAVRLADPATLAPVPVPLLVLDQGLAALQLQRIDRPGGAFAGWQPTAHAPALLVGGSDFTAEYEVRWFAPRRPSAGVAGGAVHAPGPLTLAIGDAVPNGLCFVAATLALPAGERPLELGLGAPLWLALDVHAAPAVQAVPLDGQGAGRLQVVHPGGFAALLHLQALAIGAPGFGTTPLVTVELLP